MLCRLSSTASVLLILSLSSPTTSATTTNNNHDDGTNNKPMMRVRRLTNDNTNPSTTMRKLSLSSNHDPKNHDDHDTRHLEHEAVDCAGSYNYNDLLNIDWNTPVGTDIMIDKLDPASLALSKDGRILANGTPLANESAGGARTFSLSDDNSSWDLLNNEISGEAQNDRFGQSVALSDDGSIMVVGAWLNDEPEDTLFNNGQARVFIDRNNGVWEQLGQELNGKSDKDWFGWSVALSSDGKTVAVGSRQFIRGGPPKFGPGLVDVFRYEEDSNTWIQIGQDIEGDVPNDVYGFSVSLSDDGNVVAAGGPGNDDGGNFAGHIRVFEYDADLNVWVQRGSDIDGAQSNSGLGWSVSLSADGNVVAGGSKNSKATVYGYNEENASWEQQPSDVFSVGRTVALSGDGKRLATSGPSPVAGDDSSRVRVFVFECMKWKQVGVDLQLNKGSEFPSVAIAGDGGIVGVTFPKEKVVKAFEIH